MVSYDVSSLFTNIPLEETIHLIIYLLFEAKPDFKISRKDLQKFFRFNKGRSNILFNGNMYDEVDGGCNGLTFNTYSHKYFHGISRKEVD